MIGEAYVEAFGLSHASGECHSPMFYILKITLLGWNRCWVFKMFSCCDLWCVLCMFQLSVICYVPMWFWPHPMMGQIEMVICWCVYVDHTLWWDKLSWSFDDVIHAPHPMLGQIELVAFDDWWCLWFAIWYLRILMANLEHALCCFSYYHSGYYKCFILLCVVGVKPMTSHQPSVDVF